MNPTVSVIVAAYNYDRYLGGALESVLNQTCRNLEVIVVDDGSTDRTAEVVRRYLRDPRVRYYRTDHVGQPKAKNTGIRLARAPLVAFLDADDLWLPAKLERQLALFRRDRVLGVAYTRRLVIDGQGREVEYEHPAMHRGMILDALFRSNAFVCFSSVMVRRAVLDDVGLFDESLALAIDYDLWLRVGLRYRFDYVDTPLVQYRTGHANLSRRAEERLITVSRIMERFLVAHGGGAFVSPAVVRRARAETAYHIALALRERSRLRALPWYLRSVSLCPHYALAWQGLASLPLPEAIRRGLRRALGRPAHWSTLRPLTPAERSLTPCQPLGSS
jgi:glycosyltransferase involved in cell wall biosynthesis